MDVTLRRVSDNGQATFGVMLLDNTPICVTLEDTWKDNAQSVSCIPEERYLCKSYSSKKFPKVWELVDVPNREYILIHAGNTDDDTTGCILVGKGYGSVNGKQGILRSRETLDYLRKILPDEFYLNVKAVRGRRPMRFWPFPW